MNAVENWLARPVKGFLLDISGVLRDGSKPIPGSIEAFRRLKKTGVPVRLVTNETQITVEQSVAKLSQLGYDGITVKDIFAPASAVRRVLQEQQLRPYLVVHPNLAPEFADIDQTNPNCVVLGDAAEHFTYNRLNTAFQTLIKEKESNRPMNLFSLGKGKYYMEEDGLALDVGPFTVGLEYATGAEAQICGKPQSSFFLTAVTDMKLDPTQVVMIGDDLYGDVGGAQKAGIRGVLVRTGKYKPFDEQNKDVTPNGVCDNLATAVDQFFSSQPQSMKA